MIIRPTTQRRAGGQAGIAYVVGRARPHLARHLVNHWPPIALRGRHQWPAADRIKRQRGPISGCRPYAIGLSGAIRFMLLAPLSPMSACVSGIAAPALTHPGRCRFLSRISLMRPQLGGETHQDAECALASLNRRVRRDEEGR